MERALKHYPVAEVGGHLHDTYGQALVNIYASLELGIHAFDASAFMLAGLDIDAGVDLDGLVDAGAFISWVLDRAPASRAGKALMAKRAS